MAGTRCINNCCELELQADNLLLPCLLPVPLFAATTILPLSPRNVQDDVEDEKMDGDDNMADGEGHDGEDETVSPSYLPASALTTSSLIACLPCLRCHRVPVQGRAHQKRTRSV